MSADLTERIRVASLRTPGSYAVQFDASRATLKRSPRFQVCHNSVPIAGEDFDAQQEAQDRAAAISRETGSALACFSIERLR